MKATKKLNKWIRYSALMIIIIILIFSVSCSENNIEPLNEAQLGFIENNVCVLHYDDIPSQQRIENNLSQMVSELNSKGYKVIDIEFLYTMNSHFNLVDSIYVTYE